MDRTSLAIDNINATMGFDELAREVGTPPKSLMRMLGPRGNPQARNLLRVIAHLLRVIAHIRRREKAAA